jgi:hypothetical protein
VTVSLVFLAFVLGSVVTVLLGGGIWLVMAQARQEVQAPQVNDVPGGGIHQDPDAEWVEGRQSLGFHAT